MKTSKYIIAALVGGLTLFSSCDSMEDIHKDFLEGGEIVYRAKVKDVVAEPGRNRVKLSWKLDYPTHVVRCEVREGDKVLATLPVEYQDLVEFEKVLTDMTEKTYTLSLYSFDGAGNSSVKTDVIVEIYGDRYASTLTGERSITGVLREVETPSNVVVTLSGSSSTKLIGTSLHYKSTSGEDKSVRLSPEIDRVELADVADDSYFNLQDYWKPVVTAIDEFESPMREYAPDKIPNGMARVSNIAYKEGDGIYVKLSNAASSVLRTVIKYGEETVEVEKGTGSVVLQNVPDNATITMSTIVADGEKEYTTPMQSIVVADLLAKLPMTAWEAIDQSSDIADGAYGYSKYAIDGDLASFWHTNYNNPIPPYPHHITVDMGTASTINGVAVSRRNGNNNIAAKMRLEVSDDNSTWTIVKEFSPNNSIDGLQIFRLDETATGRYFKLVGLVSSTPNAYMCIGEVNLFE